MVGKNVYDSLRQKCTDLAKLKEAKYYKDRFEKYDHSKNTLFKFAEDFLINLRNSFSLQQKISKQSLMSLIHILLIKLIKSEKHVKDLSSEFQRK